MEWLFKGNKYRVLSMVKHSENGLESMLTDFFKTSMTSSFSESCFFSARFSASSIPPILQ